MKVINSEAYINFRKKRGIGILGGYNLKMGDWKFKISEGEQFEKVGKLEHGRKDFVVTKLRSYEIRYLNESFTVTLKSRS